MSSEVYLSKQGRRSKLEIFYTILKGCVRPTRQTRVLYSANINVGMFRRAISELIEKKFLEKIPIMGRKNGHKLSKNSKLIFYVYKTTEKGLLFVKKWNELSRFWRE